MKKIHIHITENFNKLKNQETIFMLIIISSFMLSDFMRYYLLKFLIKTNTQTVYNINYLFIVVFIYWLIKFKNYINYKIVALIFLLLLVQVINVIVGSTSIKFIFFDTIFIFLPLMFMAIRADEGFFKKVFAKSLKVFNYYVYALLILGIIDYATNRGIQTLLNNIGYFNSIYSKYISNLNSGILVEQYRYVSIYGHPLRNAQLFITFYILNFLGNKKFGNILNYTFMSIVLVLGVVLSNTKTGIVIAIVLVISCYIINARKVSLKFILAIGFSILILFNTSIFKNTVLSRFEDAIKYNDLTSGRSAIFKLIQRGEVLPPKLLGYGDGFSNHILQATNQNIASLEYPFMIFGYDKGIVFTVVFYCIMLSPLIYMIKGKKYKFIFAFIVFNGYVNIFNGIAIHGDYIIQYAIVNFIILTLAMQTGTINKKSERVNKS